MRGDGLRALRGPAHHVTRLTWARWSPRAASQGRATPASQVSDKFAFGLFDLDWEVFAQHIEGAVNRVPVLEKTGVKSTVCGPGEWGARELGLDIRGPSGRPRGWPVPGPSLGSPPPPAPRHLLGSGHSSVPPREPET